MNSNFDLAALGLKAVCPNNEILYDDKGFPSIMVRIPKMTFAELGLGESTETHPAFIVNGQEVDEIYISKYQNIVQSSRAYSLPGRDPAVNINFDTALTRCTSKGRGWHLMTAFEWGALIAWCEKNGFIPLGNVAYGKYHTETNYKAIPANGRSATQWANRVLTGTGPLTWFHDNTPGGIADLCGNVWEWTGGIRTVYGELQILSNNNAADSSNSQAANAATWMAINASTGALVTPDGHGTTANTIKMDYVSSKITYCTTITNQADSGVYCLFKDIECTEDISDAAKLVLRSLGMLPVVNTLCTSYGRCYMNNGTEERSFFRGGNYNSSSQYAFPSFSGSNPRSYSSALIGFRSAFVKL